MTDPNPLYQQIISKCLADAAFRQRYVADPVATLKADFTVPDGSR
jgi:hypothetical protein